MATVSSSTFQFTEYDVKPNQIYTYYIIAIDQPEISIVLALPWCFLLDSIITINAKLYRREKFRWFFRCQNRGLEVKILLYVLFLRL